MGFLWRGMVHFQIGSSFTEHGKTFDRHPRIHHSDGNPIYHGVRPGSSRELFTTMLSLPECLAAFGPILATFTWVDQSPVSQCLSNPLHGVPYTPVTASHVIQVVDLHITLM
jgi:hypothetical protein